MAKSKTEVYCIKLADENQFLHLKERLEKMIPKKTLDRINRFKRPDDMQRSLLGEVICRKVISDKLSIPPDQIMINKSKNGKPYIRYTKNLFFNISHSGHWVVMAVSDTQVGIDIERIKSINLRVAERFFSEEEYRMIQNQPDEMKSDFFFTLWTLKESYLKLTGKGLTKSLSSFTIKYFNGNYLIADVNPDQKVFFKQYLIEKGYKLAVCCSGEQFSKVIKVIDINDLL
jgi:4'-phosphopantetheinyl transferase